MGIKNTFALIDGIKIFIGDSLISKDSKDINKQIIEINNQIKNCDIIINKFIGIKNELINGKISLEDAKKDFKNGGHVLDGVSLANKKFVSCISKIDKSTIEIDKIINRYKTEKEELRREKIKLQNK